jgi:hypothetical protein
MLGRRLATLLLVYVCLEFANPFMPGAVTFEGGSMESAKVERHRLATFAPLFSSPPGDWVVSVVPRLPSPPMRICPAPRRPTPVAIHAAASPDTAVPAEDA